jgi:hypothetical protein
MGAGSAAIAHIPLDRQRSTNMIEKRPPSSSFVLRIWWEQGTGQPTWRGWMQHAASGERHYFNSLPDLLALIEEKTGPLVQASGPASSRNGGNSMV